MEELLHDMSEINGKPDRITTFVDEDHYHDIETRLYVTGLMMIINKPPKYIGITIQRILWIYQPTYQNWQP